MSDQPRSSTPPDDTALASLVLPLTEDLWGGGWTVQEDPDGSADATAAVPEPCYPPEFPDRSVTADDAVTYVRPPGGVVHAISMVFDDPATAAQAWSMLVDEGFARCFAESLAAEIAQGGEVELLGPVLRPSSFTLDRAGHRTAAHRAAFSGVEDEGVLPVILDLAVVVTRRAVVLVWAADPLRPEAAVGWDRLLERVELRCEAALMSD